MFSIPISPLQELARRELCEKHSIAAADAVKALQATGFQVFRFLLKPVAQSLKASKPGGILGPPEGPCRAERRGGRGTIAPGPSRGRLRRRPSPGQPSARAGAA